MYSNVTPPELPAYSEVSMYSYNGVQLPALPEWDKETYPYALIHGNYTLCISTSCPYVEEVVPGFGMVAGIEPADCPCWTYDPDAGTWGDQYLDNLVPTPEEVVWSSHDILTTGGSVSIEGSTPTPILPNYLIVFDYSVSEDNWYQAHLYYSDIPFTYSGSAVTNTDTVHKQIYGVEQSSWTEPIELTETTNLSTGLHNNVYQRIYTSHDILDSSGNVWLAAGSVTPVEDMTAWLFSFKVGMSLALLGSALSWRSEPVNRYKLGRLECRSMIAYPGNFSHTSTWEPKVWNGFSPGNGSRNWSDGVDIYCSDLSNQYVLIGDIWEPKVWNGFSPDRGDLIWSDGTNIYYSYYGSSNQYVLNGGIWEPKVWNGFSLADGCSTWSDGTNIYYSYSSNQYVLNGDTWEPKVWNGFSSFYSVYIWSDGTNIYYSSGSNQYVLNGDIWEPKVWNGFTPTRGDLIWSDGTNIYYSSGSANYVLK